ncbi:MAG: mannonate dehydratase [Kiritimatiellae bacterium]|nr:mannonate dehydratase [Kiritimatiellia bacterium]
MKAGWRWFGPADAISLREIRQAGVTDVVTSLYSRRPGDVWPLREIRACAAAVRNAGMTWSVVESLPVHEDVKRRAGDFRRYVEIYMRNLRSLAKCGVKTVCYNFMPVHDWARTDLHRVLPDGSVTLAYDHDEVCAFEMFVLKRKGLEADYGAAVRARARRLWAKAPPKERRRISHALLLGLPGTTDDATPAGLRRELAAYAGIDGAALRRNLCEFLNEITPVLEGEGIDMAIHPDDPPFPIFGLPRILSSAADIREMVRACPSKRVGVTLCTGSLGANLGNDCVAIFREFAGRVHFGHFRNLVHSAPGAFRESDSHLVGSTDMPALMLELVKEESRRGREIVVRPDHGRRLDIDGGRTCYYGYDYGGRLVGLSELRGLEAGVRLALGRRGAARKGNFPHPLARRTDF